MKDLKGEGKTSEPDLVGKGYPLEGFKWMWMHGGAWLTARASGQKR